MLALPLLLAIARSKLERRSSTYSVELFINTNFPAVIHFLKFRLGKVSPQRTSKNLVIKMQQNTKTKDPPQIFSQPPIPYSKGFENDCASWLGQQKLEKVKMVWTGLGIEFVELDAFKKFKYSSSLGLNYLWAKNQPIL